MHVIGIVPFVTRLAPHTRAGITMPDRAHAVALLEEWVENEGLRKHMYAVEAAVRHYARLRGGDEEVWGLAGLLHDLDWEKYPETHPVTAGVASDPLPPVQLYQG